MAEAVIKEVIPFSQAEIETQVKTILLSKGLSDIAYPGSNISQIADIMTYLIHVLNTNTAINLQEVILPLAEKRINVLFGARQLGYEATQKTSYRYKLDISFKRNQELNDNEVFNVSIPRYTKFNSNGSSYMYMGQDIYIEGITNVNRFDKNFSIQVKEGELIKFEDEPLLSFRSFSEVNELGEVATKQNYLIPFENIEDDGIELWLTYLDDYGTIVSKENWNKFDQFLVDSTYDIAKKKFVRLENIFLQMPSVFFEVGGYGSQIKTNTLIEANILISKGKDGEAEDTFTVDNDTLVSQINISNPDVIHYGTDVESIEQIKENAPIFHNSANRAVTSLDYIAITQRHEAVKNAKVWGIEEEYLQDGAFASIFFSFIPERTQREFASTIDGSTSNEEGVNILSHMQYDLQYMPNHPHIDGVISPYDDAVTYPQTTPPVSPAWIPQPVNYLNTPGSWVDYETTIGLPPEEVIHPGEKPLTKIQTDRDIWLVANTYPPMPDNWVENPLIDGTGSTVGLELVQTQVQIDLHQEYKNSMNSVEYAAYAANDKAWYASLPVGSTYIDWLATQVVIDYITWLQDDYLYRMYLQESTLYEATVLEYENYVQYLNTPEGSEYTEYRNSLGALREIEDDNYNYFLEALELFDGTKNQLENLTDNWFLNSEGEINIDVNNPNDDSVFTSLEPYKVMTMAHNNRQPAYMNFDFEVKVVKYDLSRPASETNEVVFNIINDYFKDYVEKFDFEYISSNLQRRVDEVLGDKSGIEISLNTNISLHSSMYDDYSKAREGNVIIFKLALPYENLYTNGQDFDGANYLPSIDTDNFLIFKTTHVEADGVVEIKFNDTVQSTEGTYYQALFSGIDIDLVAEVFTDIVKWKDIGLAQKDLYCLRDVNGDYDVPDGTTINDANVLLDIYLGDKANATTGGGADIIVGRYIIRSAKYQEIDVELFFDAGVGATYPAPINNPPIPPESVFIDYDYGYLNVEYPSNVNSNSDNIPFTKYTIPRLRKVHFNIS